MNTLTTTLSSQVKGNDYFSAYRSRMEVNNRHFLQVAKELTEQGYKVYMPKNGLISWIRVESEDKHIYFGFTEVPYRWYLSHSIDYREKQGSSRTIKEVFDYDSPFPTSEIIANMKLKVKEITDPTNWLALFTQPETN